MSTIAVFTLRALSRESLLQILIPVIGGVLVFLSAATALYEARKAVGGTDTETQDHTKYDWIIFASLVPLYFVFLWIPGLAKNPLSYWIVYAILWMLSIPIAGIVIGVTCLIYILASRIYLVYVAGRCLATRRFGT